jgi:hypothetical protein
MTTARTIGERARQTARDERAEYSADADDERPLGGYVAAMSAYGAGVAAVSAIAWRRGVRIPERVGWGDLLLNAVATHKAARLIAKDPVTSPLRAPFTRFRGRSGESELAEEPRGGHRHATGELLTCPFCLAQWIATGFALGLVIAPRQTRVAMGIMAARAASDALQFGYDALQEAATG